MSRYVNPAAKVVAAGKRAMAKVDVITRCLNCGKSYSEKLSWFYKSDFKCPACGHDLDPEPFRKLAKDAAAKSLAALRAIKGGIGSENNPK